MKKIIDTIFLLFGLVVGVVGLLSGLFENNPIKIYPNAFLLVILAVYFIATRLKKFS